MIELPMSDFMLRVLMTRERVKFHQADPYGHLNSGEYVSLVMSHRVEALQDQLHCSVATWVRVLKVGYVLREISVTYQAPVFVGDALEVGSWGFHLEPEGFSARFVVLGEADRAARALGTMRFVTVSMTSGRKVPLPPSVPSDADENLLLLRPTAEEYLRTVKNIPEDWRS